MSWNMVVTDVYDIRGRGRIATGTYEGDVRPAPGDVALMEDGTEVTVVGVEGWRGVAGLSREVGLVLRGEPNVVVGATLRNVR